MLQVRTIGPLVGPGVRDVEGGSAVTSDSTTGRHSGDGNGADDGAVLLAPPIGASTWERRLFDLLTDHIKHERNLLKEYAEAAQSTDSKALAYLINLLIGDELHHHRLFKQLAESLKSTATLASRDPQVPRLDFDRQRSKEVRAVSRRLLDREEADARELKALQRELKDVKDTTLWSLLVQLMQRDTEKHMAILRFVLDHS